jgi:hypothetical protein
VTLGQPLPTKVSAMDKTGLLFRFNAFHLRWSNASLLVHRSFDGHIVSMQQSGSHWVKNMLSNVLIQRYNLPPLAHIQDDSVVGHTKSPPAYKNIPQIVHSHGFPHALTLKIPGLHFPKYLILVRDLREAMISHYERFKGIHGLDFQTFLHGKQRKTALYGDIWTRIRFFNEWGKILEANPDHAMLVHYEDCRQDAAKELRRICTFFNITDVTDDMIAKAVADSAPDKMAAKPNPAVQTTVVRTEKRQPVEAYFTPENQAFFDATVRQYLKYDLGYGYKS